MKTYTVRYAEITTEIRTIEVEAKNPEIAKYKVAWDEVDLTESKPVRVEDTRIEALNAIEVKEITDG